MRHPHLDMPDTEPTRLLQPWYQPFASSAIPCSASRISISLILLTNFLWSHPASTPSEAYHSTPLRSAQGYLPLVHPRCYVSSFAKEYKSKADGADHLFLSSKFSRETTIILFVFVFINLMALCTALKDLVCHFIIIYLDPC